MAPESEAVMELKTKWVWKVAGVGFEPVLENSVLREQLAVFKRKYPRPRLTVLEKLFWVLRATVLVRLGTSSVRDHPGRCGPMASSRIRPLLARDF